MLNFVAGVTNWLDIEHTDNQMALVSFDEIATVDIQFNDHATNIALTEDIRGQVHGGAHRSLDAGLYRMRSEAFQPSNGKFVPTNIRSSIFKLKVRNTQIKCLVSRSDKYLKCVMVIEE